MTDFEFDILAHDSQVGYWREISDLYETGIEVLGELIQNSVRVLLDRKTKNPKIILHINLETKLFTVSDNGGGFSTVEKIGLKKSDHDDKDGGSGFGVGLNAVVGNSNLLRIKTLVQDQEKHVGIEITDFYTTFHTGIMESHYNSFFVFSLQNVICHFFF